MFVGAENGNQGHTFLFNGSLEEREVTETEEQGTEGGSRQREIGAWVLGGEEREEGGVREREG